jgi:hypothetical protein
MSQAFQISLLRKERLQVDDLFASVQLVYVDYHDISHPQDLVLNLITIYILILGQLLFGDLLDSKHKLVFD